MSYNIKFNDSLERLEKALKSLNVAVNSKNDAEYLKRDSTIKRFEYTFETFWKTLKRYMLKEGIAEDDLKTPRMIFNIAFQINLINNQKIWLEMQEDRNITSHIYNEDEINIVYKNIVEKYYDEMNNVFIKLK
ncbi:MAG: hypothetical protein Ta2D_05080 [Rickettsiales bacterium]|nr:MAG: hypothetical protein Ta2D_05080 [Rickettsiales bacterium]